MVTCLILLGMLVSGSTAGASTFWATHDLVLTGLATFWLSLITGILLMAKLAKE